MAKTITFKGLDDVSKAFKLNRARERANGCTRVDEGVTGFCNPLSDFVPRCCGSSGLCQYYESKIKNGDG